MLTTGGADGAQSKRWAEQEGFKYVASEWIEKGTISYEETRERLAQYARTNRDVLQDASLVEARVHKDDFYLYDKPTDTYYKPTEWTLEDKTSYWANLGKYFFSQPLNGVHQRNKDGGDFRCLKQLVEIWNIRVGEANKNKKLLYRFNESDKTCRAILSEDYAILDNEWFLETYFGLVPDGRVTHYAFDGDNADFAVLIPDSLRAEANTEFGAMLYGYNSEIGDGRIGSQSAVFTHICMNGCIWNQVKGTGISKVHRGKINYEDLAEQIEIALDKDIPLSKSHIQDLLDTRTVKWDTTKVADKLVVAAMSEFLKFSPTIANRVLDGYLAETNIYDGAIGTAYGLVNAITRGSQTFMKENPRQRFALDNIASQVVNWDQQRMDTVVTRAKSFNTEDLTKIYGVMH